MPYDLNDESRVTYFAETDARNKRVRFGIKAKDRTRHMYVIGKTGMGKSTLLENMAVQDIQNGEGMCFIDPHGKTAELLLEYVPPHRVKDVIYFAPFDIDNPISFNVMEDVGEDKRHLVVNGLMSAFSKLFGEESFSDRMQYILQNTILALLEYPNSTMLGINRMLTDKVFRNDVIANVTDMSVKTYWTQEFAKYTEKFAAEATPAIQNKMGQFTSNPLIRNLVGQPKSTFDIRKVMDERKILIVNLSKGRVGEGNANLLGSMMITKIYLAALSRANLSESAVNKLPNFYLYVDEFQSFANKSFADILSEARKYKLNLTIAHQYIEQMEEEVRAAVFGNVGTMCTFRVGSTDAEVLEKEFMPPFTAVDLVNLGFAQIYLKLMINGVSSQPFSATTLPPIPKPAVSMREEVIESSRKLYASPRAVVEENIKKWFEPIIPTRPPMPGGTGSGPGTGGIRLAPTYPPGTQFGVSSAPSSAPAPSSSFRAPYPPSQGSSYAPRPGAAYPPAAGPSHAAATPAPVMPAPGPMQQPAPNQPFKSALAAALAASGVSAAAAAAQQPVSAVPPVPPVQPTQPVLPASPKPKAPSAQNLASLRDVLSAVKKTAPASAVASAPASAPVAPKPAAVHPHHVSHPHPSPHAHPAPASVTHAHAQAKAVPHPPPPAPAAPIRAEHGPKEIPEAMLRKMLEVPPPEPDKPAE